MPAIGHTHSRRLRAPLLATALALLTVLGACSTGGPGPVGELTFAVDTALAPGRELPAPDGLEARPVAALTFDGGAPALFMENELWLQTDDPAVLAAFLLRWDGVVLSEVVPEDAAIAELPKQYLVRVKAPAADAEQLTADLRTLDRRAAGALKVSSQEGLDLLAAASHESAGGLGVGINWVGSGDDMIGRSLAEAPAGDAVGGVSYQPNPFEWPSHARGGDQDIGVAEAWRALALAGKLGNRVKVAILDMGFQPDQDTPAGWTAYANVPYTEPIGTENFLDCGSPCPWHGTSVLSAAMALAGNGFGAAGPAGPVADAFLVFTSYDFFTSISALVAARAAGAKVANMSYSAGVPWVLGWSVLPFEATTKALRLSGMLMFASAGNDGVNVDREECTFGACWERTWYTPCENAGVICVGGLRANRATRAPDSNYGPEQVDLFAPFTLLVGPDPLNPGNRARSINGTSFSSPFAAGVAALVWAANPSLGVNEVENLLISTAHPGGDASVSRIVNALGAVKGALGNVPPYFELAPSMTISLNQTAYLSVTVSDLEDEFPCCTVTWASSVDGALGSGWQLEHKFTTLGQRTITVKATDSAGATYQRASILTVVNDAPVVTLVAPRATDTIYRTSPVNLSAQATDRNEPGEMLACARLTWTSSVVADPFPLTGCTPQVTFASNGARTLTVMATDPQGAQATASVQVTVVDPPPNLPPVVRIDSPTYHQDLIINQPATLRGSATDPEGATALTYRWTVQFFDGPQQEIGTGPTISWTPKSNNPFNQEGTYRAQLRLFVTDPAGQVGVAQVELEWVLIF